MNTENSELFFKELSSFKVLYSNELERQKLEREKLAEQEEQRKEESAKQQQELQQEKKLINEEQEKFRKEVLASINQLQEKVEKNSSDSNAFVEYKTQIETQNFYNSAILSAIILFICCYFLMKLSVFVGKVFLNILS